MIIGFRGDEVAPETQKVSAEPLAPPKLFNETFFSQL